MALTGKRKAFVREYLKDSNATQAAIRAGYSPNGAGQTAHVLLKNPEIAAALAAKVDKAELKAEEFLQEIRRIAMFDPARMYGEHGELLPIQEMPEDVRRVIAGLDPGEHGTKVRLWSKIDALRLGAQNLKLLTENVHHTGDISVVFTNVKAPGGDK